MTGMYCKTLVSDVGHPRSYNLSMQQSDFRHWELVVLVKFRYTCIACTKLILDTDSGVGRQKAFYYERRHGRHCL